MVPIAVRVEDVFEMSAGQQSRVDALIARLDKLERRSSYDRWWDLALKLLVPLSMLGAGAIVRHEIQISSLQDTRVTKDQAAEIERRVSIPPQWLRDQVSEISARLRAIEARVR